jgi:hypothetical protein
MHLPFLTYHPPTPFSLAPFTSRPAGSLQMVYQMMRRRGTRTTLANLKPAVEEGCGRRFTLHHLAQLAHLLPHAFAVEWVHLPIAPHSSRTEPQLLVTLNNEAAAATDAADVGSMGAGAALTAANSPATPYGGGSATAAPNASPSPRQLRSTAQQTVGTATAGRAPQASVGSAGELRPARDALRCALARLLLQGYAARTQKQSSGADELQRLLAAEMGAWGGAAEDFLDELAPEVPPADLPTRPPAGKPAGTVGSPATLSAAQLPEPSTPSTVTAAGSGGQSTTHKSGETWR